MDIDISGKHLDLTDGLREHVLQKMHKLDKFSLKTESAHIVFEVQRSNHVCEIILTGKNIRMTAIEHTSDMYASFDAAVASIQKQLARYHEKIKDHRPKHGEVPIKEDQGL